MKSLLLASLTTLALSTLVAPSAQAQPRTAFNPHISTSTATAQLSPADLVFLARNGYLREQGVPSNGALADQFRSGKLTAQELVARAIQANRLPAQVAQDQGYIFAVESNLQTISYR
jgi:hypothetical protein